MARDRDRNTALHAAVEGSIRSEDKRMGLRVLQLLLDAYPATVQELLKEESTPLRLAARCGLTDHFR